MSSTMRKSGSGSLADKKNKLGVTKPTMKEQPFAYQQHSASKTVEAESEQVFPPSHPETGSST